MCKNMCIYIHMPMLIFIDTHADVICMCMYIDTYTYSRAFTRDVVTMADLGVEVVDEVGVCSAALV